jgi:predicted membrane protein
MIGMKKYKVLLIVMVIILMIVGLVYYRNYYVKDLLLNQKPYSYEINQEDSSEVSVTMWLGGADKMVKYIFEDDRAIQYHYSNLSISMDNELIVQAKDNIILSKNEEDSKLWQDFNDWLKELGISKRELIRFIEKYLQEYKEDSK